MPSNRNKKIESIKKVLGVHNVDVIFNLITNSYNVNFVKENGLSITLNLIGNYAELLLNGDYNLLTNKTLDSISDEWNDYHTSYKNSYSTKNYIEKNKIILDNRINGNGFYWVDLEKEFCIESMIRMEDCGRVNCGNTTLELREQCIDYNVSHMVIVYNSKSGDIRQVKGKGNQKPEEHYWIYFYNFLINTDYKINKYIPTYKPEKDLLVSDLEKSLQISIYKKHTNLMKNLI
jgi:hypothetical protein